MSELELLDMERRMEYRWREVAFPEPHTSQMQLERNYDRYLKALNAYMRAKREFEQNSQQARKAARGE